MYEEIHTKEVCFSSFSLAFVVESLTFPYIAVYHITLTELLNAIKICRIHQKGYKFHYAKRKERSECGTSSEKGEEKTRY